MVATEEGGTPPTEMFFFVVHDNIYLPSCINSSRPEPKITHCTQCQYLQNRNCAEMSKIATHLKIGTHLPFQFSLCYYHKNEIISKPSKILHKARIVCTFLWYSMT